MLTHALKAYSTIIRAVPSPLKPRRRIPTELGSAIKTLKLGVPQEEITGKAISAGLCTGAFLLILAFFNFDVSLPIIAIFLSATTVMFLLYFPVAVFRVKKARITSDSIAFLLSFTTHLRHANQETAYHRAIQGLSPEFKEPWLMLRLGEATSISEALVRLASRLRPYSHQLHSVFINAASEVQEAEPDYTALLKESLSALQVENSIELGRFAEKIRGAIAIVSFTPLMLYMTLPFASAFTGYSVDLAFLAASIGVIAISLTAFLYLLSHYPSAASFADLSKVEGLRSPSYRYMGVAFGILLPLSIFYPIFLTLLGTFLIVFALKSHRVTGYLEALKQELASLPLELKEVSRRLKRGEPLEEALRGCSSHAMRAMRHRAAKRLFPERIFAIVEDTLHHLRNSGDALGKTLEELGEFIRELLNYRSVLSARMESPRGSLFLLFILLPVLSLFSLWAFNFIAQVSSTSSMSTPYLEIISLSLISRPPNVELVLGFMTPAIIACMTLFTFLSVLCEDTVAPQLLKAKTATLGAGTLILGAGETLLF